MNRPARLDSADSLGLVMGERAVRKLFGAGLAGLALLVAACVPTKPPPPPPAPDVDVLLAGDSVGFGVGCVVLGDNGADDVEVPPSNCPPDPNFSAFNGYLGACSISSGYIVSYNKTTPVNEFGQPAGNCQNYSTLWAQLADALTPELVVIVTGGWEIVDRWTSFPFASPGCTAANIQSCSPGPNLRWGGDAGQVNAAKANYKTNLTNAINLFRDRGAQVLVLDQAYVNPLWPIQCDPPAQRFWWEPYPNSAPTSPPCTPPLPPVTVTWESPNNNAPYASSKPKVENFNSAVAEVKAESFASDDGVRIFDFWAPFSPGGQFTEYLCNSDRTALPSTCPSDHTVVRHPDGGHFTSAGYEFLGESLLPEVYEMLGITP